VIDPTRLEQVVGGNWVSSISDTVGPAIYSGWDKLSRVTRANQVSEVGEAIGAIGGFAVGYAATHKMGPGRHPFVSALGGVVAMKVAEGFSRQYTFAKYNEAGGKT